MRIYLKEQTNYTGFIDDIKKEIKSLEVNETDQKILFLLLDKLAKKNSLGHSNSSRLQCAMKATIPQSKFTIACLEGASFELRIVETLHSAVLENNIEKVAKFLGDPSIDINARDANGRSVIQIAADKGFAGIVSLLVSHPNIDVNITDKDGWSALYRAVPHKDTEILQLLLHAGAKVNLRNKDGSSPLIRAVDRNNRAAVEILLNSEGVKVDTLNILGTALFYAAKKGYKDLVELLLKYNADPNKIGDSLSKTPLAIAKAGGHEEVVKLLEEAGAEEKCSSEKCSALHLKVRNKEYESLAEDVDAVDEDGRTAAHYWAYEGDQECAEFLIRNRANLDAADKFGRTPLHYAIMEGRIDVIETLLQKDVDSNTRDAVIGYFPLFLTAHCTFADQRINVKMAELLLNKGVDHTQRDNFGWTTFQKAAESNNVGVAELLLERGLVNVNETTQDGSTALHRSATYSSKAFVEFLIANGAESKPNKAGKLPLDNTKDSEIQALLTK